MTTETPEPQLTEAEIQRIAARKPNSYGSMVNLPIAERDALIRDWRAMKAEIADYEQTDLVPRTRYNVADAEAREAREMVKSVAGKAKVEIERLETENAALRKQLAQAESEVRGVLDVLGKDAIHSHPDGGTEDIYESLAISVAKLQSELAKTKQHRNDLIEELRREREK